MLHPPYFLLTLLFQTKHIFAHYSIIQPGGIFKIRGNFSITHDNQAVGKLHNLIQVCRNQKHSGSRPAQFHQLFTDKLRRAYVNAARRLVRYDKDRIAGKFPRNNDLLDIPAGKHANLLLSGFAEHLIIHDKLVAVLMHCLHVKQGPFVVAFAGNTVGHQVFFNRSSARNTECHAVLRYQRNAQIAHHTLGLIQHRFPIDRNRPAVRRIQAEQHVYQLSLPVALNTRNAQYLAFAHVKGNPVQHFFVPLVRIFQIPDLKHDFRRHSLLLLHRQDNITPYH